MIVRSSAETIPSVTVGSPSRSRAKPIATHLVAEGDVRRRRERRPAAGRSRVDGSSARSLPASAATTVAVDRLGLAGEADVDRRRAGDDVGVRQDLAVGGHDHAGADGAALARSALIVTTDGPTASTTCADREEPTAPAAADDDGRRRPLDVSRRRRRRRRRRPRSARRPARPRGRRAGGGTTTATGGSAVDPAGSAGGPGHQGQAAGAPACSDVYRCGAASASPRRGAAGAGGQPAGVAQPGGAVHQRQDALLDRVGRRPGQDGAPGDSTSWAGSRRTPSSSSRWGRT